MHKFKEGDVVVCIKGGRKKGAGWKLGHEYTITHVRNGEIYFGGIDDCGVYEESLKLKKIDNWKEVFDNGKGR